MDEHFRKYHALGNDYLVVDPGLLPFSPLPDAVRMICERTTGAGSDGILLGPLPPYSESEGFGLRIFNPDGSEAEKSGNGLRIFSLYLAEAGYVSPGRRFFVRTAGGTVASVVESLAPPSILVDMGEPSFELPAGASGAAEAIPQPRELIQRELDLGGERLIATFVSMGNPHCVIFVDEPEPELARRLGPIVEHHPLFPNRTNVQFAKVLDPHRMRIEIWERGAGYTLASGSSSCAAAAAARRLGLVAGRVVVQMPGGELSLDLSSPSITMRGPAVQVYRAAFSPALLARLAELGALGPEAAERGKGV
ncbi:MAG TPA: diaminopimelate epimerase [Rectinemataceae bacterium]